MDNQSRGARTQDTAVMSTNGTETNTLTKQILGQAPSISLDMRHLPPASGQAGMNATEDKTLQMIDLDSPVGQTAIVFSKIGYLQQTPANISCWDPRAALAADCSLIVDSFMVGKILWLGTPVPATLDSWAVEQGNVAI